jgi:2-polyprenyl-3-methyl-5-hydroxy-6-metoxy-1,4-benzoquinol methylase
MSTKYRETLYSNYHSTQSGRASLTDATTLFNREKWRFSREILPHFNGVNKDAKIYDLGCGSGSLIQLLKEKGYVNLKGLDLSQEQVKVAHSMGVTEVQEGDAIDYLKTHNGHFDVIVGTDIIEHFTKDELVDLLKLIQEKLSPNGKAIFRTPNLDSLFASVFANGDFTHENYLNASSAQQVMLACGFQSASVHASDVSVQNPLKELLRKMLYMHYNLWFKLMVFATGRSTRNIVVTPNMIITATKK